MKALLTKKSVVITIISVIVAAIIICAVCIAGTDKSTNQKLLENMVVEFVDMLQSHNGITVMETESVYGKLNGNGNGINYFGASLIKANDADLEALTEKLDEKFEAVEWYKQSGQKVQSKYLEHRSLSYSTQIEDDSDYITVLFYNSGHEDSDYNDLAGH